MYMSIKLYTELPEGSEGTHKIGKTSAIYKTEENFSLLFFFEPIVDLLYNIGRSVKFCISDSFPHLFHWDIIDM